MSIKPEDLIGTWHLATWEIRFGDGKDKSYPFGDDAIGQLLYSADGYMSATISRADRPPLSTARLRQAPIEEKAEAFEGYYHYAGSWQIDGDYVVHQVSMSLNPGYVGTEQRRLVSIKDCHMTLSTADQGREEGNFRRHYLVWRRE
jgi:hypothetical protein